MSTPEKSRCRYRAFKKLPFYASGRTGGYGDLTPGCHVMFAERYQDDSERERMGRVLGIATHDGTGAQYKRPRKDPMLAVLVPSDDMHFAYVRHIAKSDIRQLISPGAFARWFLFGAAPSPELAHEVSEYGALSDSYVGEYLTAPEGALRSDWHEVAMRRAKRAG